MRLRLLVVISLSFSFSSILFPTLATAHGDAFPVPKLFGRNVVGDLKAWIAIDGPEARHTKAHVFGPQLDTRQQNTTGPCGPTAHGAVCAAGYCCGDMV